MKTAVILHGMPSKEGYFNPDRKAQSNEHWLPWLQRQLLLQSILAQTPELPEPYAPDYEKWRAVFEQFPINEETILVGHSCGAGFLLRWLSENKVRVGKIALVAPWIDQHQYLKNGFFDFTCDPQMTSRTAKFGVFYSTDDDADVLDTVKDLKEKLPNAQFFEFTDKGHFIMSDMKTEQFPELAAFLLQ